LAKPLSAANVLWPVKYKLSVPHTLGHIEIIGTKKKMRAFWKVQITSNVWDSITQEMVEPNADERERAMGFPTSTTNVHGMSEQQRRFLLGQAMDLNCLTWVVLEEYVEQRFFEQHTTHQMEEVWKLRHMELGLFGMVGLEEEEPPSPGIQ
jgi:hypothetical protein